MKRLTSKKYLLQGVIAVTLCMAAAPVFTSAATKYTSHSGNASTSPAGFHFGSSTPAGRITIKNFKLLPRSPFSGGVVSGIVTATTTGGIFVQKLELVSGKRGGKTSTTTVGSFIPVSSATHVTGQTGGRTSEKIKNGKTPVPATSAASVFGGIAVGDRVMAIERFANGATTTESVIILPTPPSESGKRFPDQNQLNQSKSLRGSGSQSALQALWTKETGKSPFPL